MGLWQQRAQLFECPSRLYSFQHWVLGVGHQHSANEGSVSTACDTDLLFGWALGNL